MMNSLVDAHGWFSAIMAAGEVSSTKFRTAWILVLVTNSLILLRPEVFVRQRPSLYASWDYLVQVGKEGKLNLMTREDSVAAAYIQLKNDVAADWCSLGAFMNCRVFNFQPFQDESRKQCYTPDPNQGCLTRLRPNDFPYRLQPGMKLSGPPVR